MASEITLTASRIQADTRLQPRALRLLRQACAVLGWDAGREICARWTGSDRGEVVEVCATENPLTEGWSVCSIRRNGGVKGAEALYINCRPLLKEVHASAPLSQEHLHAEVENGVLRIFLRELITPEVYGLRVWGNRRQKKTPLEGRRHEAHIDLMLYNDTLRDIEAEAEALGMPLRYYLRQIIEQRQPLRLKHSADCHSHQERAHIVKKAQQVGHQLSVEELRERGLPLCYNRDWMLARRAEAMSYTQMAEVGGGGTPGVYSYWGREKWGLSR